MASDETAAVSTSSNAPVSSEVDDDILLQQLDQYADTSIRLKAIESLRHAVRANKGRLLFGDLNALFTRLKQRLEDSSNSVIYGTTQLLNELSNEYGNPDIDSQFALVIPTLVQNLGHSKSVIRRATVDVLLCFTKVSRNRETVYKTMLEEGLANESWRVRKETLDAFSILLSHWTHGEQPANVPSTLSAFLKDQVVSALIGRLRDVSDAVTQSAIESLSHLQLLLGEDGLQEQVDKLPALQQKLFSHHAHRLKESVSKPKEEAGSEFTGTPLSVRYSSSTRTTSAATMLRLQQKDLLYGFMSQDLYHQLSDKEDWKVRALAIEQLQQCASNVEDFRYLSETDLLELLEFIGKYSEDSNFKINLVSLHILEDLLTKLDSQALLKSLNVLLKPLMVKLADNKMVLRQATMAVFHRSMQILGRAPVMTRCYHYITDESSSEQYRLREEALNLIIASLLHFPVDLTIISKSVRLELDELLKTLVFAVQDSKNKIKYIALEAFAVLASQISNKKLQNMLQDLNVTDNIQHLIQLRLNANSILPTLSSDGLVEHHTLRTNSSRTRSTSSLAHSGLQTPGSSPGRHSNQANMLTLQPLSKPVVIHRTLANRTSWPLSVPTSPFATATMNITTPVLPDIATNHNSFVTSQKFSSPHLPRTQNLPEQMRSPIFPPSPKQDRQISGAGVPVLDARHERERHRQDSERVPIPKKVINFDDIPVGGGRPGLTKDSNSMEQTYYDEESTTHKESIELLIARKKREIRRSVQQNAPSSSRRPQDDIKGFFADQRDENSEIKQKAKPVTIQRPTSRSSSKDDTSSSSNTKDEQPKPSMNRRATMARRRTTGPAQMNLDPFESSPDKAFALAFEQLKRENAEWEEKANAFDALSHLLEEESVKEYTLVLFTGQLHELYVLIVEGIYNLRTQVSKSAIQMLDLMLLRLGKSMCTGGPDLDNVVSALFKKLGEGSGRDTFMTETVDKTLDTLCRVQGSTSPTRVLTALYASADHKNATVRAKVSQTILKLLTCPEVPASLILKLISSGMEMERLLPILSKNLRDGLVDTRTAAKRTLMALYSRYPDFVAVVDKHASIKDATAIKEVLSNDKGGKRISVEGGAAIKTMEGVQQAEKLPKKKSSIAAATTRKDATGDKTRFDTDQFKNLLDQMNENDWKRRYDAITAITEILYLYPEDFKSDGTRIVKLFDCYTERLRDSNSKVNLYALQTLQEWISVLKDSMNAVLITMLPVIASNLAASNGPIRNASHDVLDSMITQFEEKSLIMTVQTLSNLIQFGSGSTTQAVNSVKVKSILIDKILASSLNAFQRVLTKSVIPILSRLVQNGDMNRAEIRPSLGALAKYCEKQMGLTWMDHVTPGEVTKRIQSLL